MKRIFIFLLGGMMVLPSLAGPDDTNELCKRRSVVMVVLERDTNGEVLDIKDDTMSWRVGFGYDLYANTLPDTPTADKGIIIGSATCNEISYKSSLDGTKAEYEPVTPGDANTFLKSAPQDRGPNCWCKMDGPVTSWWVFVKTYTESEGGSDKCGTDCTKYCANGFADKAITLTNGRNIRYALFDAIW